MTLRPFLIAVAIALAVAGVALLLLGDVLASGTPTARAAILAGVALLPALATAWLLRPTLPTGAHDPAAARTAPSGRSAQEGPRERGTVKWFNRTKGYGFIVCDSGQEVFVHHRSIRGEGRQSLRDGEAVEFVVVDHPKGRQAEDVTRVA